MRFLISVLYLFCLTMPSYADMYKWIDESGTTHFSDAPPDNPKYNVESRNGGNKKEELNVKRFLRGNIYEHPDQKNIGENKILNVLLESEDDESAVFSVEYTYKPANESDVPVYNSAGGVKNQQLLTIHLCPVLDPGSVPRYYSENNDVWVWSCNVKTEILGKEKERKKIIYPISLSSLGPRDVTSTKMQLYMYVSKGGKQETVFSNIAPFEKSWKKK